MVAVALHLQREAYGVGRAHVWKLDIPAQRGALRRCVWLCRTAFTTRRLPHAALNEKASQNNKGKVHLARMLWVVMLCTSSPTLPTRGVADCADYLEGVDLLDTILLYNHLEYPRLFLSSFLREAAQRGRDPHCTPYKDFTRAEPSPITVNP